MGIKHFFSWLKRNEDLKRVISKTKPQNVDHLMIDMNGVIHEAAQKIFKYGKYAPLKANVILPRRKRVQNQNKKITKQMSKEEYNEAIEKVYECIKSIVHDLIKDMNPNKTIYLAVDGPAPKSKQNQQRQRRFKAARDGGGNASFDSVNITAGTKFMENMCKHIENEKWTSDKNIKVITSGHLQPGEGEHKLVVWARKQLKQNIDWKEHTFCIVGADADLILLGGTLECNNVFIMRESETKHSFHFIDIGMFKKLLPIDIEDLIVWSCFIGNDFLPPIPSLEIKESYPEIGALDFFFEQGQSLILNKELKLLNFSAIRKILTKVVEREQSIMEARAQDGDRFENPLWKGDVKKYRKTFHETKLKSTDSQQLVLDYMKTVYWVYLYYTRGIPSWDWYFPHSYGLHADKFVKHMPVEYCAFKFPKSQPYHPHEQLLCVVPPTGKSVIPEYLHEAFDFIIGKSTTFETDVIGKRQEWEATVIVDVITPHLKKTDYVDVV